MVLTIMELNAVVHHMVEEWALLHRVIVKLLVARANVRSGGFFGTLNVKQAGTILVVACARRIN